MRAFQYFMPKGPARLILGLVLGIQSVGAQGAWPGCSDVADSEITTTPIVTRSRDAVAEPMKMAFDLVAQPGEDAKDKVDIYFTERNGKVRRFDSRNGRVLTLGQFTLTIAAKSSDGLLGIALDPGFKANHRLYLYYTYSGAGETSWRVSRFTLDAAHETLDMQSETVLLKVPMQIGSQHPGGALQFDAYGDLWITTGDNYLPGGNAYNVHTSGNTNDLRGKVLRIHPEPDGTYSIPEGNLFPEGAAKTRPEIYVMGTRNPYTLSLDPVRRWAVFGDIGPDSKNMDGAPLNSGPEKTEEYNIATAPGNFGYPFFVGPNFPLKSGVNPAKPVIPANTNWNGAQPGLDTLPPIVPSIYPYRRACAITGPLYRYDGDLNSSVKLPPHFHRKWFVTDFNAGSNNIINLITLNDQGTGVTAFQEVLKPVVLYKPLDMQIGPDGALYVVNYAGYRTVTGSTGIVRIGYSGACRPPLPKLEMPTGLPVRNEVAFSVRGLGLDVKFGAGAVLSVGVATEGVFSVEVRDLHGRLVDRADGRGRARVSLAGVREGGVYVLRASAPEGKVSRMIVIQ